MDVLRDTIHVHPTAALDVIFEAIVEILLFAAGIYLRFVVELDFAYKQACKTLGVIMLLLILFGNFRRCNLRWWTQESCESSWGK